MYYYSTPNYSVALNAKVGSSTMARLIIKQFYPEEHRKIVYARFPNAITENQKQWHWMCPGSQTPDKPIVLMVRNPIDRFMTACQQIAIKHEDIDKAIDSLLYDSAFLRTQDKSQKDQLQMIDKINEKKLTIMQDRIDKGLPVVEFRRFGYLRDDVHFFHQYKYIQHETYLFKFPEQLKDCLEFVGINNEPITINKAKREKPTLSEGQMIKLESYYKTDIDLFNSIEQPGQLASPKKENNHGDRI